MQQYGTVDYVYGLQRNYYDSKIKIEPCIQIEYVGHLVWT